MKNHLWPHFATIKDLGEKWFAILEMENQDPNELIARL